MITIGEESCIDHNACIYGPRHKADAGHVRIGARCVIASGAQIHSWGGGVCIGNDCSVNANTILYGTGGIRIGNGVRIAANSVIVASSHIFNSVEVPIHQQGYTAKGIVIEDDCWIGAGVCILDGVRIQRGAIVGAGSLVRGDIDAFAIVGGVPSKLIKQRNSIDGVEAFR